MYILGVDCAWTEKEPSGVALIEYQNSDSVKLIKLGRSYKEFCTDTIKWENNVNGSLPDLVSLLDFCQEKGWNVDIVALDIPLSSELITGRRSCDREISRAYGRKGAAVHSPSAERPGQIALSIYHQLTNEGYKLNSDDKAFIEVYPHASIIELFGLDYRLPYKAQKKSSYWSASDADGRNLSIKTNLRLLREGIAEYVSGVCEILPDLNPRGYYKARYLKGYEDALDAIICAITGLYYCSNRAKGYGDKTDMIWVAEPEDINGRFEVIRSAIIPSGGKRNKENVRKLTGREKSTIKATVDSVHINKADLQNKQKVRCNVKQKSTDIGYINRNNQINKGKTNKRGTDHGQWFYQMECRKCGHEYFANGTDIWQRKCPKCQGGRP